MNVYLGTDHAGFEFKEQIKKYLIKKGYNVVDCGAHAFDADDDYPDFISIVGKNIGRNKGSYGIVLGKSGAGECMVANKYKGTRAFLAVNEKNVRLARQHNNANIMSLGSEIISLQTAKKLIDLFLQTPFSEDQRHLRRIDKIKKIENKWN